MPSQVLVTGEPFAPSALMVAPLVYNMAWTNVSSLSKTTLPCRVPVPASVFGKPVEPAALPLLLPPGLSEIPGKFPQFFVHASAKGGCSSDF